MQTRTKPQPTSRIRRRPTPPPQGRFKRHASPAPSTSDKAMSALSGMLGGGSAAGKKKAGRGRTEAKGGRAGKMALLAGGLGLMMKNRAKVMGVFEKRAANRSAAAGAQPSPPPPPPGA